MKVAPAAAFDAGRDRFLLVWSAAAADDAVAPDELELFGQFLEHQAGELFETRVNDFRLTDSGSAFDPDFGAFDATLVTCRMRTSTLLPGPARTT